MSLVSLLAPSKYRQYVAETWRSILDRMFTSRSEYRVSLRADNADIRLTEKGREAGAVSDKRWRMFFSSKEQLDEGRRLLKGYIQSPHDWLKASQEVRKDGIARRYVVP